jgi:serine/threonine-protein kinase
VAAGLVVSSDPAAGTDADQGSTVTLTVSTGPGTFKMPDVVGLTASNATALLESLGLKVSKVEKSSATVASGSVISSDPSGGAQVLPASSVVLTVSTGPAAPGPTSSPPTPSPTTAPPTPTLPPLPGVGGG